MLAQRPWLTTHRLELGWQNPPKKGEAQSLWAQLFPEEWGNYACVLSTFTQLATKILLQGLQTANEDTMQPVDLCNLEKVWWPAAQMG